MPTVTERELVPRPPDLPDLVPVEAVVEVTYRDDAGVETVTYYDGEGSPVLTVHGAHDA